MFQVVIPISGGELREKNETEIWNLKMKKEEEKSIFIFLIVFKDMIN